jgi:hypothetical protein
MKDATHSRGGELVKAVQWNRDGDHPKVSRYPIEKREYKGILVVSAKEKYALKFGDWVVEDAAGRVWVVAASEFERSYAKLDGSPSVAAQVVAVLIAAFIGWWFRDEPQTLPILLGVTHLMYYTSLLAQWNGSANIFDLDEAADDIKLSAHTNTYSVNQDTHDFFDDVTNEVSGTNYTAGGAAIGSQTLTRSTTTVTFDGADVVWTQSAGGFSTARKFVLYRNAGGVAANSRLFSVVTADADVGNVTGDLTVSWSASGIATWSTT